MQHTYNNYPVNPVMEDARKLFERAVPEPADGDGLQELENCLKVLIVVRASRVRDLLHTGQSIVFPG
jgi:hypothetical protein